ncbi:MAG: hypothetical protein L6R28_17825 [Planctomycetes bacterium]|nr:hypothetical protein [Planctomycetota bacterium]
MSDVPESTPRAPAETDGGADGSPAETAGAAAGLSSSAGQRCAAPTKLPRRWRPRFSLRTLTLCVLLFAAAYGLWLQPCPWELQHRLGGHAASIAAAAWSPDGELVLTYARSYAPLVPSPLDANETIVWDARTGERMSRILFGQKVLSDAHDFVHFSADSRWVIVGYDKFDFTEAIFDARTGEPLLPGSLEKPPSKLHFSPDGLLLLVEFKNRAPELWDLAKRERRLVFENVAAQVNACAFSPDGTRIAICFVRDYRDVVEVFDTSSGQQQDEISVSLRSPLFFSPDGRRLVGSLVPRVEEENFNSLTLETAFNYESHVPSARTCAVDLQTGKPERIFAEELVSEPRLFGGRHLLFADPSESAVRDTNTLELLCHPEGKPCFYDSISSDGKRMVTTESFRSKVAEFWWGNDIIPKEDWYAEWDIENNHELCRVKLPNGWNEWQVSLSYAKQDRRIVLVTSEKVAAWDSGTGENLVQIAGGDASISPDGRRALLWRGAGDMRIGDLDSGDILAVLDGTANKWLPEQPFAASGDRLLLLTSKENEDAQIWERRRDEGPWGIVALPEFWLTILFALLLLWSLVRDFRTLRKAKAAA